MGCPIPRFYKYVGWGPFRRGYYVGSAIRIHGRRLRTHGGDGGPGQGVRGSAFDASRNRVRGRQGQGTGRPCRSRQVHVLQALRRRGRRRPRDIRWDHGRGVGRHAGTRRHMVEGVRVHPLHVRGLRIPEGHAPSAPLQGSYAHAAPGPEKPVRGGRDGCRRYVRDGVPPRRDNGVDDALAGPRDG